MQSNKKIKCLRMLAVVVAIAVVFIVVFGSSALRSNGLRRTMKQVDLTDSVGIVEDDGIDAADPSNFTDANPEGEGAYKVAETNSLILYVEEGCNAIRIYDKRADRCWYSRVTDSAVLNNPSISDSSKNAMQSLLSFSYMDLTTDTMTTVETYSATEEHTVAQNVIEDGIQLVFSFTALNLKIAVDFTINGDSFTVSVPDDGIVERQADEAGDIQKEITTHIKEANNICNEINGLVADMDSGTSERMLVELAVSEIREALLNISTQVASGLIDDSNFYNISMSMDSLSIMTDIISALPKKLIALQDVITVLQDKSKKVSDNRSSGLIELSILPYFGSQVYGTDGYVFYPDGCGALSYFNITHPEMSGTYAQRVYDLDRNSPALMNNISDNDNAGLDYYSPVRMPVYGIKVENSAFVSVLTEGDVNGQINYTPCTETRNISNIFASFFVRQSSSILNNNSTTTDTYDKERIHENRSVQYWFLHDENASYSGMAVTYRSYLEKSEVITPSVGMSREELPLALSFCIGIDTKRQKMNDQYVSMTTFQDIQSFLELLQKKGISGPLIYLDNWTKDGGTVKPTKYNPAASAGGMKALKELNEYITDNGGALILEGGTTLCWQDSLSSTQQDVVTVKNKSNLTLSNQGQVLLNPVYVYNRLFKIDKPALTKIGVNGLDIGDAGWTLYYDYNQNSVVNRAQTAAIYRQMALDAQKSWPYITGENVNAYLYQSISWNREVPIEDSHFLYTDETVPFLQMVIHGSMVYTGTAFNEVYDAEMQMLKCVEYGYIPYYFLTEQSPIEMSFTGLDGFYSTQIDKWEQKICDTYQQYQKDFGEIWKQKIQKHEQLSDNLYCTTYDNGTCVYVNYADEAATIDGIEIAAKSYRVVAQNN